MRPEHGFRSRNCGLGSGNSGLSIGEGFLAAVVRGWNPAAFTRHSLAASPFLRAKMLRGEEATQRRDSRAEQHHANNKSGAALRHAINLRPCGV